MDPWWRDAHEAAGRLASTVEAARWQASRDGVYEPPPGTPAPRRRRQAGSLRHLAEVIRTHRLAPGLAMDKDIVARVLDGDLRHITDPVAVVAVARASCLIAGVTFGDEDARRLTNACAHVAALVEAAREADRRAPQLLPAVTVGKLAVLAPSRTARSRTAAVLVVALLLIVGWFARPGGDELPAVTVLPVADNPNCDQDAPPAGSDLLDVPHARPEGETKMNDWWPSNGHIEMGPFERRQFEATVRTGRPSIWDLVILRSCLPLTAGRSYRLSFTAQADKSVVVRVRVQEPNGAVVSYSSDLRLGPQPQRLDVTVVADRSSRQGELMFQVGGQSADYRLRVTDIALA